jgi:RNA-splicing ligase RtcB
VLVLRDGWMGWKRRHQLDGKEKPTLTTGRKGKTDPDSWTERKSRPWQLDGKEKPTLTAGRKGKADPVKY